MKNKKGEKEVNRIFLWKDHGPDKAVLYGPVPYKVAAVVELDPGDPELMDGRWIMSSNSYKSVRGVEEDTSIPIQMIKKRVLIKIMDEMIRGQKNRMKDMENINTALQELGE